MSDPHFPRYTDRPQDGPPENEAWVPPSAPHPQQQPPVGQPYAGGPPPYQQQYAAGPTTYPQGPAAYPQGPTAYPPEDGYGYPAMNQPGLNSLALAALVSGLIGLGPLPLGLGIGALYSIRRTRETGTWMAVTGIVLGAVQTLLFGLFAVLLVIGSLVDDSVAGPETPAPVQVSEPYTVDIGDLGSGECFDETERDFDVVPVPCDEPHAGEVYALLVLPPRAYPGDRAVQDEAEASRDREFAGYVGIDVHRSRLETDFVYPDREMWEDGGRDVICLAYGPDGEPLEATVKGSKR